MEILGYKLIVSLLFGAMSVANPHMGSELFSRDRQMGPINADTGEYGLFDTIEACNAGGRTELYGFHSVELEALGVAIFMSETFTCLPVVAPSP